MGAKRVLIPKGEKEVMPWWGFGLVKRKIPVYDVKWQKSSNHSMFNQVFSPHDYKGQDYEERKENALEDAENNLRFYKTLVREGVLPEDTKLKIKKIRHTDAYHLEFWMPNLSNLENTESIVMEYGKGRFGKFKKKVEKIEKEMDTQIQKIKSIAEKFGYDSRLGEDVYAIRNYGYDSKRELRLHDVHVLGMNLPNKYRKKHTHGIGWYNPHPRVREWLKSLEGKVTTIIFGTIILVYMTYFFNNLKITGNAILISNKPLTAWIILAIIFGITIFLLIKKHKFK